MTQKERASLLFDAIGGIDDALIQEANAYRPIKKRVNLKPWVAACASFILCIALVISSMLSNPKWDAKDPAGNAPNQGGSAQAPGDNMGAMSLSGVLDAKSAYARKVLKEEIPYFDGVAYLVWQKVGTDVYYISEALTSDYVDPILDAISDGYRAEVGDTTDYYIWLIRADGTVLSPHLMPSMGNLYYGTIFSYDVELIPSDNFTDLLATIPV